MKEQKKALVVGWFSFINGHATAGDLLVRDVICSWLIQIGVLYDIAVAPPFEGGVDWRTVKQDDYDFVFFVCGPFQKGELEAEFLNYFKYNRLIGINLSMLLPITTWNPWDLLLERDSSAHANPDLSLASQQALVPLVGICLVEEREGAMVKEASAAIQRLISTRDMAIVHINTRLDIDSNNHLRNPAEIETLLARMDVVITTRLHGSVLALKNGTPVISIDPDPGGAKVRRQMETLGWPIIFNIDTITDDALQQAFDYCLTEDARTEARKCRDQALKAIESIRLKFISSLTDPKSWLETSEHQLYILEARTNVISLSDDLLNYAPKKNYPHHTKTSTIIRKIKKTIMRIVKYIKAITLR
jgi:hypothetical protein